MSDSNHATDPISVNNNDQHVQFQGTRREDPILEFTEDEEDLIARMFRLVGKRWSLIAGRIPGKTAEEIEKYWTSKSSSTTDQSSS